MLSISTSDATGVTRHRGRRYTFGVKALIQFKTRAPDIDYAASSNFYAPSTVVVGRVLVKKAVRKIYH